MADATSRTEIMIVLGLESRYFLHLFLGRILNPFLKLEFFKVKIIGVEVLSGKDEYLVHLEHEARSEVAAINIELGECGLGLAVIPGVKGCLPGERREVNFHRSEMTRIVEFVQQQLIIVFVSCLILYHWNYKISLCFHKYLKLLGTRFTVVSSLIPTPLYPIIITGRSCHSILNKW